MTTPAINLTSMQHLTCSGTRWNGPGAPHVPETWETDVPMVWDQRPQSSNNPIRTDGTRRDSAYSRRVFAQWPGSGTFVSLRSTQYNMTGQVTASVNVEPDLTEALTILNGVRAKTLAGISQGKSQFNVAAYEARSTVRTIQQFCQKGVRGMLNMYNRLPADRKKKLGGTPPYNWRDVPGDYLGYIYGLAPLADDIANGFDQLSGLAKQNMSYGYSIRGGSSRNTPYADRVRANKYANFAFKTQGMRKSFARVGYEYRFPHWWIENNPIVTPFSDAWELTRMSFVLDWVLPVGNWLGAMESAQFDPYFHQGYEVWGAQEVVPTGSQFVSLGDSRDHMSNDGFRIRRFRFTRVGLDSEDSPSTRVKFPSFRNFLGVSHAAQAMSLLTQVFKTPPSRW